MPPILFKIAKFLALRPSDRMIRIIHIVSGLLVIALLWIAQDRSVIDVPFVGVYDAATERMIEYALLILGIFPLVKWLIPYCLVKHQTLRIAQGVWGFLLIIVGGPVMDPIVTTLTQTQKSDDMIQLSNTVTTVSAWHPGIFLILLGILWIFIGLTGKGTTSVCIHYGEIVRKIRV